MCLGHRLLTKLSRNKCTQLHATFSDCSPQSSQTQPENNLNEGQWKIEWFWFQMHTDGYLRQFRFHKWTPCQTWNSKFIFRAAARIKYFQKFYHSPVAGDSCKMLKVRRAKLSWPHIMTTIFDHLISHQTVAASERRFCAIILRTGNIDHFCLPP